MSKKKKDAPEPIPDNSEIIERLERAIEGLVSRSKNEQDLEDTIMEAKRLTREWKDSSGQSLFGDGTHPKTSLLAALVRVLKRDHELLELIRRHRHKELERLRSDAYWADARAEAHNRQEELSSTKKCENSRAKRDFRNSIEYQFGLSALSRALQQYEQDKAKTAMSDRLSSKPHDQTCFDGILAGASVNSRKLSELFWEDRHPLLKKLPSDMIQHGRKASYDHRHALELLGKKLSKKLWKKRKRAKVGRPPPRPWLEHPKDPGLRARVLAGLEARIKWIDKLFKSVVLGKIDFPQLSDDEFALMETVLEQFRGYTEWRNKIADPFLAVIRRHLDSGI